MDESSWIAIRDFSGFIRHVGLCGFWIGAKVKLIVSMLPLLAVIFFWQLNIIQS